MLLLLLGCFRRDMPGLEQCGQSSRPPVEAGQFVRSSSKPPVASHNSFGVRGVPCSCELVCESDDSRNSMQARCQLAERPQKHASHSSRQQLQQQQQQQQLQSAPNDFDPSLFVLGDRTGSSSSQHPPPPSTQQRQQGPYNRMCLESPSGCHHEASSSRRSSSPVVDHTALSMTTSSFVSAQTSRPHDGQYSHTSQSSSWSQHRGPAAGGSAVFEFGLAQAPSPRASHQRQHQHQLPRPSLPEAGPTMAAAEEQEEDEDEGWGALDPATCCSWDHSFCSMGSSSASFNDPYKYGRMISYDGVEQMLEPSPSNQRLR